MATAADLKVGDLFTLADDGYFRNLLLREENIGRELTVESIDRTTLRSSIRITLGGAVIDSATHNYRYFSPDHPVTIIEQEQDMPAIEAFASDLRVGDVFTVADLPDTTPLWMPQRHYTPGTELTVTMIDAARHTERNQRVIHFTGTSHPSKVFDNDHRVTIVRRANDLSASALETPQAPATTEIPEGLYPALPYGTPVTFSPEAGVGQGLNTGTVGEATWSYGSWNYTIRTGDGRTIHRHDRGAETVVPTPESAPTDTSGLSPETPRQVIPRTSDAAKAMLTIGADFLDADTIDALKRLALYLPGGRAEQGGNELAARKDLCIQYEAIVCPQLGWAGREHMREHLYVSQRPQNWLDEVVSYESRNAGADAPAMIRGFARRYARGGVVNEAIVDHMRYHLEQEKYEATNQVLDALGLQGIEVETEKEYRVTVRLERVRTVTEYQYVSTVVTAGSADAAFDDVSSNINMDQYAEDDDWVEDDYSVDHSSIDENWDDSSTEEV